MCQQRGERPPPLGPLEVAPQRASLATGRRFRGAAADSRRNQGAHVELVAEELMPPLGVVPRVGQERLGHPSFAGCQHGFDQVRMIGTRPAAHYGGRNQMGRAGDQQCDLREAAMGHGSRGPVAVPGPATDEAVADVIGLAAAAVDSAPGRAFR